jgi:hypothetical protein
MKTAQEFKEEFAGKWGGRFHPILGRVINKQDECISDLNQLFKTVELAEYEERQAQRDRSIALAEKYIRETSREERERNLRKYQAPHWYDGIVKWFRGNGEDWDGDKFDGQD